MSTILDALRKLQRERAAQSPAKDLRGSVTHEAPRARGRRRGAGSRRIAALLALLAVGGGGYVLYHSGQVHALLARFQSEDETSDASDEEFFAAAERESPESEATPAPSQPAPQAAATPPAKQVAPTPRGRAPRPSPAGATPPTSAAPATAENPEIAVERARLDAALANARAAQEAQARAELDAETRQAVPQAPPEPEIAAAAPLATPPVPSPSPARPIVAKRTSPVGVKSAAPVVAAKPEPNADAPAPRPAPEVVAAPAPPSNTLPEVRVESIRWHPIAERRVASLHFERQVAPEAREGDIVGGVLVYRIDPGSVELRVGSAQRTVTPGP